MFDETGVFIAACQHGFILVLCDMVKSGNLSVSLLLNLHNVYLIWVCSAKYGLAVTQKLLHTLGDDITVGYDIGCAFASTINSSVLLHDQAKLKHLWMLVPAFHGYAHTHACQLSWNPLYIPGVGLEDFETAEHIFLQPLHVMHWPSIGIRQLSSGPLFGTSMPTSVRILFACILNKPDTLVTQASFFWITTSKNCQLYQHCNLLLTWCLHNLTDTDFIQFYNEEKMYLASLQLPPANSQAISYVEALEKFESAEWVLHIHSKLECENFFSR